MHNSDETDWLRKRLDAMIQLLLEFSSGGVTSTSSKIERLLAMGFSSSEVAQIIGKKVNYVTATVAMKKKGAARKKRVRQPAGDTTSDMNGDEDVRDGER